MLVCWHCSGCWSCSLGGAGGTARTENAACFLWNLRPCRGPHACCPVTWLPAGGRGLWVPLTSLPPRAHVLQLQLRLDSTQAPPASSTSRCRGEGWAAQPHCPHMDTPASPRPAAWLEGKGRSRHSESTALGPEVALGRLGAPARLRGCRYRSPPVALSGHFFRHSSLVQDSTWCVWATSVSWAHHLGGRPVRGAGPGFWQASGGHRATPVNSHGGPWSRGTAGEQRASVPCAVSAGFGWHSPAVRGSAHTVGITRCVASVCFSLSIVFSGHPRGSKCWDFAPLWLSDALPCEVGLLVTDGHSDLQLCCCGCAWRGVCTDVCCHLPCVATQNEVAGVYCKFTFNCLRSCQAALHSGRAISQAPSHAGRVLVSPHPPCAVLPACRVVAKLL